MKMNIVRFFLAAIVVWYCGIFISIVHADERPQFLEMSQENIRRNESLGTFAILPNELIEAEVLNCFDPAKHKALHDNLMLVNTEWRKRVLVFFKNKNDEYDYTPWQGCEAPNSRVLYYTYSYMGKIIDLHMTLGNVQSHRRLWFEGNSIEIKRLKKLCLPLLESFDWLQGSILQAYSTLLYPCFNTDEEYSKKENTVRELLIATISKSTQVSGSKSKIPAELLIVLHCLHLETGEFWLAPLQYLQNLKGLKAIKGPLFAPLNEELLSLRLALKDMRKDNPHYLETLDRVVSLEPMPTISRLEELAQAWLDGKNISKARRLFERALNARLAVGEKVDPSYYINLSELCYQNGKFSKATHYFLKGIEGLPSYHQSISNSDKFELRSLLLGGSSYFSDGYKHLQEIHYKHASESSFKAGEVCEKAKQYEEAAKFFSTTIYLRELCQEKIHPMEHLKIAELFYNCQLYKQALLSFIKGIELLTSNLRQVRPAVDERHAFESAQKVYDECCSGGQFGEAGDLLAKFISVCTKNGLAIDASFHKRVGDAYFRADRFSDAIGAYKEEANLRRGKLPLDADYHKRMGDAHMGAKNFDLAKNSYDNRINALQKDNQSITLACLDAQRACERSTNSVVRQQASKYASMATPVREGDRG